jgi:hypothetical protein
VVSLEQHVLRQMEIKVETVGWYRAARLRLVVLWVNPEEHQRMLRLACVRQFLQGPKLVDR